MFMTFTSAFLIYIYIYFYSLSEVECDDPVIEHGVKITGFRDTHRHGNDIVFECNIGYYMIGSFLIHCGDNNMWNPGVPSCEKSKNESNNNLQLFLYSAVMN